MGLISFSLSKKAWVAVSNFFGISTESINSSHSSLTDSLLTNPLSGKSS